MKNEKSGKNMNSVKGTNALTFVWLGFRYVEIADPYTNQRGVYSAIDGEFVCGVDVFQQEIIS